MKGPAAPSASFRSLFGRELALTEANVRALDWNRAPRFVVHEAGLYCNRTRASHGRLDSGRGWQGVWRGEKTAARGYARGPENFTRPAMHAKGHKVQVQNKPVPGSTALCPLGLGGVSISRLLRSAPSPGAALLSFVGFSGLLPCLA